MTPCALELKDVSRSWEPGVPVFSGLSLEVPRRGITVLLGPSGCGKSTLLRCAASLDCPESGTILADGVPVTSPSPERQLILQGDNQLLPWLTVAENTAFPLRRGKRKAAGAADGDDFDPAGLLKAVGLPDSGDSYPASLSGGMKQRAVLARALAVQPAILLLDEPFAALDTVVRTRLQRLLRTLHSEQGTAMLLVTHDIPEALVLGDRIVFMDAAGNLSDAEENPLGGERDVDSFEFHQAAAGMRRRYGSLLNPENP